MQLLNFFFIILLSSMLLACNKSESSKSSGATTNATQTISGILSYDFIPVTSSGLNYAGSYRKPLRKIFVEIYNATGDVLLGSTSTDSIGQYQFTISSAVESIYLLIWAEIKTPSVVVEDNTQSDAIYAVNSSTYKVGTDTVLENINIPSGWVGSNAAGGYSSTSRFSGPYAIVDTILTAIEKVSAAKPSLVFPALNVNWSVDNVPVSGDVALGRISTSHYNSEDGELYILGRLNVDTDEHDAHVIVHEWGHYFEDRLGRSDSIGGEHGSGDLIDFTVAFGEGWGNALSAIVLDPAITYRDTFSSRQQTLAVSFSLETSSDPKPGWFSETSVQQMLFDIYDSTSDTGDTLSAGLVPLIDVMTTYQKTTRAKTSIFSFINGYKSKYPSSATSINTLTTSKSISNVVDDFGTGESNDGGFAYSLPVYKTAIPGGSVVSVELDGYGLRSNEMTNNRYAQFTATSTQTRLTWHSTDTYAFSIFDGETTIHSDEQIVGDENADDLPDGDGPWYYDFTTVPGRAYTIRIFTEGEYVFSQVSNVIFEFYLLAL